jgi:hypothetical protein
MNKKAATRVVVFLLSVGGIKIANSDIDVSHADNYIPGEMKGKGMINYFRGLSNGFWTSRPLNK